MDGLLSKTDAIMQHLGLHDGKAAEPVNFKTGRYMIFSYYCTLKLLSIDKDMYEQTVQTKIRQVKDLSDQGLQCLRVYLNLLDALLNFYYINNCAANYLQACFN